MYLHTNQLTHTPKKPQTMSPQKQQSGNKLVELLWQKDGESGLLRSLPYMFWKFPWAKV